jgi:hypothetical protein
MAMVRVFMGFPPVLDELVERYPPGGAFTRSDMTTESGRLSGRGVPSGRHEVELGRAGVVDEVVAAGG